MALMTDNWEFQISFLVVLYLQLVKTDHGGFGTTPCNINLDKKGGKMA